MKPFLILQLRPETEVADEEFAAFLRRGRISPSRTHRIQLDREELPGDLSLDDYAGIIVGGGPACVSDTADEKDPNELRMEAALLGLMPEVTARDFPFLGCCYGIGLLGQHLGARVSKDLYGEPIGRAECYKTAGGRDDPLLAGLPERFPALVGHKEALDELPAGTAHLVTSAHCPFQMIRYGRNVYATQFHPEAGGESFALRIRVYKYNGYFHPDEADSKTELCRSVNTKAAGRILSNFTARYGSMTSAIY